MFIRLFVHLCARIEMSLLSLIFCEFRDVQFCHMCSHHVQTPASGSYQDFGRQGSYRRQSHRFVTVETLDRSKTAAAIMGYVGLKRRTLAFISFKLIFLLKEFLLVLNMARLRIKGLIGVMLISFSICLFYLTLRQSLDRFENDPLLIENW